MTRQSNKNVYYVILPAKTSVHISGIVLSWLCFTHVLVKPTRKPLQAIIYIFFNSNFVFIRQGFLKGAPTRREVIPCRYEPPTYKNEPPLYRSKPPWLPYSTQASSKVLSVYCITVMWGGGGNKMAPQTPLGVFRN